MANVDAFVDLPDGSSWTLTIFTVEEVSRLLAKWKETGEVASGRYFWVDDHSDPGSGPQRRDTERRRPLRGPGRSPRLKIPPCATSGPADADDAWRHTWTMADQSDDLPVLVIDGVRFFDFDGFTRECSRLLSNHTWRDSG